MMDFSISRYLQEASGTPIVVNNNNGTGNIYPRCVIDRSILNEDTISKMENAGLSIFAPLCGRNRGVFVLDPPDGNTYGCLSLPASFAEEAGVNFTGNPNLVLNEANDITNQFADHNITSLNAVDMIDLLSQAVYQSTPGVKENLFGCDVTGLAKLECSPEDSSSDEDEESKIRSVTLAGLFTSALWATGGVPLSFEDAKVAYSKDDFHEMASYGINTVQIPIPLSAFAANTDTTTTDNVNAVAPSSDTTKVDEPVVVVVPPLPVDDNISNTNSSVVDETVVVTTTVAPAPAVAVVTPTSSPVVEPPVNVRRTLIIGEERMSTNYAAEEAPASGSSSSSSIVDVLTDLLEMVNDSGLKAILVLDNSTMTTDDGSINLMPEATSNAVSYASQHSDVVMGVTLPNLKQDALNQARADVEGSTLKLFLPVTMGDLTTLKSLVGTTSTSNIVAALDLNHASTIPDVASSTSLDDRMKLFYHESVSCIQRSPLEYTPCYQAGIPVFVAKGFDLSVDDCIHKGLDDGYDFEDYGQCDRFDETIHSNWWFEHRSSFAQRQLSAYERGVGWSFATWKLLTPSSTTRSRYLKGGHHNNHNETSIDEEDNAGLIDVPAKLLSFRDIARSGLLSLSLSTNVTSVEEICLNPPVGDFVLGDDTLPPTPSPPPDCGNGWWNFTTEKCDYWIPPPPPPKCVGSPETDNRSTLKAAGGGLLAGIVITAVVMICWFNPSRSRQGYSQLP